MLHIPIRGVFLLTRAAALCVAAAAVPILVKQAKPLAKKIGDELEKFGKWMKEEAETVSEPKASPTAEPKPNGNNGKSAAAKPATAKSAAKKPAPRKRTTKAKPKPKPPTT